MHPRLIRIGIGLTASWGRGTTWLVDKLLSTYIRGNHTQPDTTSVPKDPLKTLHTAYHRGRRRLTVLPVSIWISVVVPAYACIFLSID